MSEHLVIILMKLWLEWILFFFFYKSVSFFKKLINLFIFGCVGSSFLCEGSLQLRQAGATLHRGARASHCRGLSCRGAQAPDAQAQYLWLTGFVAPRHVGSSQTRARTHVPCIGRQTLNHCATREALEWIFKEFILLRNVTGDGHRHITIAGPRQTVEKRPPFFLIAKSKTLLLVPETKYSPFQG